MPRIIFFLVLLSFVFFFECFVFNGIEEMFVGSRSFTFLYWVIGLLVYVCFYLAFNALQTTYFKVRPKYINLLIGFGFAILISKFLFMGLLLLHDVGRLLLSILYYLKDIAIHNYSSEFLLVHRNNFIIKISLGLASFQFLLMMFGSLFGKYRFQIENVHLRFQDLPKSFDGFRIAQISDIHSGTFDSIAQVKKGVDLIIKEKPDLIVFTGDLVNSHKDEINPYLETFAKLRAPYGMYSIMGNHDYYGMYNLPKEDNQAKSNYLIDFESKHKAIGFELLNNSSIQVKNNREHIRLLGVENWGAGPFPKKGDLEKALDGVNPDEFCILLSHDPTHWDYHVIPNSKKINLTLSGHTHGMQFGINLFGYKWSPVKYRYKRWMGLYSEADQFLYVNRGFGLLAWPGRVGMRPEITIIELNAV